MSRGAKRLERPNLVQCFDSPGEAWNGRFGWVCGYSAEGNFLDQAAERFTRQTASQRAHSGTLSLAVMLDPGNPAISLLAAPGVAHLPIRDAAAMPFALLHAKVALLGFCNREEPDDWIVRLIVSTGNWTRQTMEESLDLVWCIEVRARDLDAPDEETRRRCADIKAAHEMLDWLSTLFDTRLLEVDSHAQGGETGIAVAQLDTWLARCAETTGRRPSRFIHNRQQSLLAQLPDKIRRAGIENSGKWLAMGSGYYETASKATGVPTVLTKIIERLQDNELLSQRPNVHVFVNPNACQAIAQAAHALAAADIRVHPPGQPGAIFGEDRERALHAKFLFGYNYQSNSKYCLDAWVYLGSGNLTQPGFTNPMRAQTGNLEAGVVFAPPQLLWEPHAGYSPLQVIGNVLPVQWTKSVEFGALQAGGDMPERPDVCEAPPVAWLRWEVTGDETGALLAAPADLPFEVLDEFGAPCTQTHDRFEWRGTRPRVVSVRWRARDEDRLADIPVVDEFGRIAATPLPALELDEAWWRLASFPLPATADDAASDEAGVDGASVQRAGAAGRAQGTYAVREMMAFIEQLADRQTAIAEPDWSAWCCRLEQTLALLADSEGVRTFRELALNPLHALRVSCFRPSYAETDDTPQGQRYGQVIDSVEQKWEVAGLCPMGEAT
ncbi:hypothetical protein [Paraburkholderia terrae]|uniref:hypothetical protein n=1 Tax=Paraburkholderia terrae TaxID=311230 RepID=UPI00205BFF78|nr:hypothetical protein [Paraburkholderia terrae]BDC39184.1 hypothetical protein PTKU15_24810 [Paraburkholderia terrae]